MANTINFAGYTVTVSKRGRPLVPSLIKALTAKPDEFTVIQTSRFDGMIDQSRYEDVPSHMDVVVNILREKSPTLVVYVDDSGLIIRVSTASIGIDVLSPEAVRRRTMLDELPIPDAKNPPARFCRWREEAANARRRFLAKSKDALDFDERCDQIRGMTDPEQIIMTCSGVIPNYLTM